MTPEYADAIADLIRADIFTRRPPAVIAGLPRQRSLHFSDECIVYTANDEEDRELYAEKVLLDEISSDKAKAERVARWLGERFERSGIEERSVGWVAWAARDDGKLLVVCRLGFALFDNESGFNAVGEGASWVAAWRSGVSREQGEAGLRQKT